MPTTLNEMEDLMNTLKAPQESQATAVQIPKTRKKKSKGHITTPEMQADPKTRKSYLGKTYPDSVEANWYKLGDHWVHQLEHNKFSSEYACCQKSDAWVKRDNLRLLIDGFQASVDWANKNGYTTKCSYSGRLCQEEDTFKVFEGPDKPASAHNKYASKFFVCSYYNLLMTAMDSVNIKGSIKYNKISHLAYVTSGLFKLCDECGFVFEKSSIAYDKGSGMNLCPGCLSGKKYQNVIHAWNDKTFPQPMYDSVERYGHKVTDSGLVVATNKKEPIKAVRLFGAEAEVELSKPACVKLNITRHHLAYHVKEALGADFVAIKEDGTLTLNGKYSGDSKFDTDGTKNGPVYAGFEIVTAPADIKTHEKRWKLLDECPLIHDEKGNRLLRAWDTTTCGFHVHVSRESLSDLQIGRILRFVNHKNNAKFIHKIAGRGSDTYCRYLDKQFVDVLHPERVCSPEESEAYNRKRRVAVNISNEKTIEFRIFRGTIHPAHIMRNIEFCDAVCNFCFPASRSLKEIETYAPFIAYVSANRKQYPNLASWFATQKQIAIKKIKEGIDVKKLTIRPDMILDDAEPPPPSKPSKPSYEDTF